MRKTNLIKVDLINPLQNIYFNTVYFTHNKVYYNNNKAANYGGGAIYSDNSDIITFDNSSFISNNCFRNECHGGAVYTKTSHNTKKM